MKNNLFNRPWGTFEIILKSGKYQVKKITIFKKEKLSLHSHSRRDEHWIVVSGEGTIEFNNDNFFLRENDYLFIPRYSKHRISNDTDKDLVFIEIQYGNYLEEDDIIRYEDAYGRA